MNKIIKLISLIIISLSVYFIYYSTYNSCYQITTIGDRLSLGNSTKDYMNNSYIEYYKEYIKKENNKVTIDSTYTKKNQTIENYLQLLKNSPEAKRKLIDSNLVIITLGYNEYFVLADNRKSSDDSRLWGPVESSDIKAKVIMCYFPFKNFRLF